MRLEWHNERYCTDMILSGSGQRYDITLKSAYGSSTTTLKCSEPIARKIAVETQRKLGGRWKRVNR